MNRAALPQARKYLIVITTLPPHKTPFYFRVYWQLKAEVFVRDEAHEYNRGLAQMDTILQIANNLTREMRDVRIEFQ